MVWYDTMTYTTETTHSTSHKTRHKQKYDNSHCAHKKQVQSADLFLLAEFPQSLLVNVDVHQVSLQVIASRKAANFAVHGTADQQLVAVLPIVSLQCSQHNM